jgi:hypothetical protein
VAFFFQNFGFFGRRLEPLRTKLSGKARKHFFLTKKVFRTSFKTCFFFWGLWTFCFQLFILVNNILKFLLFWFILKLFTSLFNSLTGRLVDCGIHVVKVRLKTLFQLFNFVTNFPLVKPNIRANPTRKEK